MQCGARWWWVLGKDSLQSNKHQFVYKIQEKIYFIGISTSMQTCTESSRRIQQPRRGCSNISGLPIFYLWYLQNKLKTIKQKPLRPFDFCLDPPLLLPQHFVPQRTSLQPHSGPNPRNLAGFRSVTTSNRGFVVWGQVPPLGLSCSQTPQGFWVLLQPGSELQLPPHLPTQKSRKMISRISSVPPPPVRRLRCPRATRSASAARAKSLACLY